MILADSLTHKGGPGPKGLLPQPTCAPAPFLGSALSDSHLISFTTSRCELLVTMVPFTCRGTNDGVSRMDAGDPSEAQTPLLHKATFQCSAGPPGHWDFASIHMCRTSVFPAGL